MTGPMLALPAGPNETPPSDFDLAMEFLRKGQRFTAFKILTAHRDACPTCQESEFMDLLVLSLTPPDPMHVAERMVSRAPAITAWFRTGLAILVLLGFVLLAAVTR